MLKKKVALFYNPVAGGGTFGNNLDKVIHHFQKWGLQLIPWRITNNEQITEQMSEINSEAYHTIIAAGGDGTIHGVVNAMMKGGLDIPLGIFPTGTVNDVANYLRISHELEEYCRIITEGNLQSLDLGYVNNKYFINVASAGFLTQTAHEVDYRLKNVLGKMAYYLKGIEKIPQMQPLQIRLQADGQSYELEALVFLILNGGTAGSFQGILPEGKMNDGKLDFVAIKSVPLHRLAQLLFKLSKGQLLQDDNIFHCEGQQFLIDLQPSIITDLDGEIGPDLPWQVSVCPQAILVRIP